MSSQEGSRANLSEDLDQETSRRPAVQPDGKRPAGDKTEATPPPKRWYRRPLPLGAAGLGLLVILAAGVGYYVHALSYESTDDAFIEGHIIPISPKVAGQVATVHVDDNQEVKEGTLLAELDPRDFAARLAQARGNLAAAIARHEGAVIDVRVTDTTSRAGVDQAEAEVAAARAQVAGAHSRLEQARAQVRTAQAAVEQARAGVTAAEANLTRDRADAQRFEELYQRELISRQDLDHATAAMRVSAARLQAAREQVAAAEAQLAEARAAERVATESVRQGESQLAGALARLAAAKAAPDQVAMSRSRVGTAAADIAQLEAALKQAELDLSYTKVYAPEAGRVTRKRVEPGAYVQVGQFLLAVVPRRYWVIANFKETQLTYMRPGQPVTIKVDTYPGKVFKGHVDSIQAGSGARFSLLPPENATGNYVKVVQRVPVKIAFDEPPDPRHPLGPGMSVVPKVRVR